MISGRIYFGKKFFSLLTIIGLCLPTLMSLYPSYAYADEQAKTQQLSAEDQREQEEKARDAAEFARHKAGFCAALQRSIPTSFDLPFIINPIEWSELDVSKLVGMSGMPVTGFGHAGLFWLSLPVSNHAEIVRRQGIIRTLVQDEASFNQLRAALQNIKKGEDALIMYWTVQNKLHYCIEKNILPDTKKPEKLSWIGEMQHTLIQATYGKYRDKFYETVPGLEVAAASPLLDLVGLSFKAYLTYCLSLMMWQNVSDWKNPEIWKQIFMPSTDKASDIFTKTFEDLWWPLYPWDRMQDPNNPGTYKVWDYKDGKFNKDVDKTVPQMGPNHIYQVPLRGSAKDKFSFGSEFVQCHMPEISNAYPFVKDVAGAGLVMSSAINYYLYYWGYFEISKIWKDGKELCKQLHLLHASLVDIARLMRNLKSLQLYTTKNPAFKDSYAHTVLELLMGKDSKASPEFKELMELFATKTFDSADTSFYSRGRVLRAHILLQKVAKGEMVPLVQAIAELDGYHAIARLMKAYEHKENKYVFAKFIESDTPCVNIDSCWEPLAPTKNPVVNDIRLGANGKPVRMIITGPNGGGKSTYLKSLGHAVIMAQSWGIVPAGKAELTIFNELRTSLDPKEDLAAGISKFTAQKERIGNIAELMEQSNAHNKMLVILDEPYTGTIDDQMADRVYEFGAKAAQKPHTALCIATHVKKPIELARNGSFANYQIEIQEPTIGQFVRTFKIKEGAAHWWFNDKPRVTRFIDWLNPVNIRKNPGVVEAVAETPKEKTVGTQRVGTKRVGTQRVGTKQAGTQPRKRSGKQPARAASAA